MAENASLFWAYTEIQNAMRWWNGIPLAQQLTLGQLACAGGGAGAITSFVLYVRPAPHFVPVPVPIANTEGGLVQNTHRARQV